MKNFKRFSRAVKQEITRVSLTIKQIEFRLAKLPGYVRKKAREELMELKRIKDAIARKAGDMRNKDAQHHAVIHSIREDITLLHQRCRQLKTQHY
jgi:hypothetical protein